MGIGFSKKKDEKINLPEDYKLIKIMSYNVRLIFGSPLRANKIGYFLSKVYDNIENDIICLQGIYDIESRDIIVNIFKNDYPNVYIIPEFDSKQGLEKSEEYKSLKNICNERKDRNCDCKNVGILILSKYEVLDYKCKKFKEGNDSITEYTGIVCININVDNNIISIYNTQLQSDYKDIISNTNIRKSQLEQVKCFVKDNIGHLGKNSYFDQYKKTNINLIVGSLNIPGKNIDDRYLTEEYLNLITNFNYLDIYKMINEDNDHIFKDRNEYILLYLLDDSDISYENLKSKIENCDDPNTASYLKRLKELPDLINTIKELKDENKKKIILKKIFKFYKINFIKTSMSNVNYSDHYPIELIVIIKTKPNIF